MMKEDESIYLELLRIGAELTQRGEPITRDKILDELKTQRIAHAFSSESWEKYEANDSIKPSYRAGVDSLRAYLFDGGRETGKTGEAWMPIESFLGYLEYVELQEARESAKEAKRLALWAISISIVTMVISVAISFYQINSTATVKLEEGQLKALSESFRPAERGVVKPKTPLSPPPPLVPLPPDQP